MDSPIALLRRYGIQAKKSWGQCFLKEPGVLDRIVEASQLAPEETVIEIGAGLGTLTARLAERASRVYAIERDRELVPVLRSELGATPSVRILEANALTLSFAELGDPPRAVVGNLPYNISSPILFHLIDEHRQLRKAILMLQREVAERLCAAPGSGEYGIPTLLLRRVADARICFGVSPSAFTPRPRVDSAVVRIDFLETPREPDLDPGRFAETVRAAFRFRRKTLRRALELAYPDASVGAALEAAGIDGGRRGETLDLAELGRLARALERQGALP